MRNPHHLSQNITDCFVLTEILCSRKLQIRACMSSCTRIGGRGASNGKKENKAVHCTWARSKLSLYIKKGSQTSKAKTLQRSSNIGSSQSDICSYLQQRHHATRGRYNDCRILQRCLCVQMRVEIMSFETCMTRRDCPATVSYCVISVHVWSQAKTTTPYHTRVCAWKSNPRSSWRRVSFMKVDGVIDKSWAQFDDVLQHDKVPKCANTC